MKHTEKNTQKKPILPTLLTVLVLLAAAAAASAGIMHFFPGEEKDIPQARSAVAREAVITSALHAGGTLTDADATGTDIPQGVELEFTVDDGDAVSAGDLIAVADTTSVQLTIDTLRTRMDALDEKIRTAMDTSVSATITAPVAGRVKDIFVTPEQSVTEAMYENGALMLLSLDGYMAVEVEWPGVTVGTSALVTLENGETYSGRVASIAGTSAVVIFSDYGPGKGDIASVTAPDGTILGEGEVYIHSELAVTGYYGYVEDITVSREELVELGDELLTLSDANDTAGYAGLLAERAVMERQMQLLFTLQEQGGIYAESDGYVVETNTGEETANQNQNQGGFPMGFMGMADRGAPLTVTLLAAEPGAGDDTPVPPPEITPEPTPEPTPIITPEPTPIITPEPTPIITPEPTPEITPEPDNPPVTTPVPEETPAPSATPGTSGETTPTPEPSPEPTNTPENPFPTDGPQVTATPEPTPESTNTPKPVLPDAPVYDRENTFALAKVTAVSSSAFGGGGYTLSLNIYDASSSDTEEDPAGDASDEAGDEAAPGEESGDASEEPEEPDSFITSTGDFANLETLTALLDTASYAAAYSIAADTVVYTYENGAYAKNSAAALKTGDTLVFVFADEGMTELLFIVRHPSPEAETDTDTDASDEMSSATGSSFPTSGMTGMSGMAGMTQTKVSAAPLEEFQAFAITPDTDMTVSLTIDEMDIGHIQPGMEIDLRLDALPEELFVGTVTHIGGSDANEDGSGGAKYTVEVTLARTKDMRAGMNAAATVTIGSTSADVTVPVAALFEEGARTVVYTGFDSETGTLLNPVEVVCGVSDGFTVEILEGLVAGDAVYYFYEEEYSDAKDL